MNTLAIHPRFQSVLLLLKQQLGKIADFHTHLNAIKLAITENNIDQLGSLIEQTSGFYAALESIQSELDTILNNEGYIDQTTALQQFIDQHDDAANQLQQVKIELKHQVTELEKALLVNDLLVRKNQHRIKQSIKILSGHSLNQGPATYSRKGDSDNDVTSQKTLARA